MDFPTPSTRTTRQAHAHEPVVLVWVGGDRVGVDLWPIDQSLFTRSGSATGTECVGPSLCGRHSTDHLIDRGALSQNGQGGTGLFHRRARQTSAVSELFGCGIGMCLVDSVVYCTGTQRIRSPRSSAGSATHSDIATTVPVGSGLGGSPASTVFDWGTRTSHWTDGTAFGGAF